MVQVYHRWYDQEIILDATPNYLTFLQCIYEFYHDLDLTDKLKVILIVCKHMACKLLWIDYLEYHTTSNYTHKPTPYYIARKGEGWLPLPPSPVVDLCRIHKSTVLPCLALETEGESNVGLYALSANNQTLFLDQLHQFFNLNDLVIVRG
ncbi:hypothetical protein ACA910_019508 [Epithemia clementina (nom. ined.)]